MNKRYLPVIAVLLIAVTCTAFLPVFAQLPTYIYAAPTLSIVTIAQDDQLRSTGVMWLAPTLGTFGAPPFQDLMSQFKLSVSYNGVFVYPDNKGIYCQVVEKDKVNPMKNSQGSWENLATTLVDMTQDFVCKPRWVAPGIGVLDVYYVGAGLPPSIADYVLVVSAFYTVGRSVVFGSDMQDICILGWPVVTALPGFTITKPDGTKHLVLDDALGPFKSCEDLALLEQNQLGVPIPWT